jgi:Uma2 family endonuclease
MAALAEVAPRLLYADFGHILMVRAAEGEDTEALFERICSEFENKQIEQDCEGNVYIMAPAGGESSSQNSDLTVQLGSWAKQDQHGRTFDSSAVFVLPDRSKLGSDAAWVRNEKLATLTLKERRRFLKLVPDFIIELKSPSDHFSDLQKKMQDWRRNGVELGWLIHPDKQLVLIYRQGTEEPEVFQGTELQGDGTVAGFVLYLQPIWQGLRF